jgi:prepilin-type N-terminal cleavage/methylation domain-containing protein
MNTGGTQAGLSLRVAQGKARGFSLIELLIVVAIILIIAAIAIPNFMRARIQANEAAAISNLRTVSTANVIYTTQWAVGYAAQFSYLGGSGTPTATGAVLIDVILAGGAKNGYTYTYTAGPISPSGTIDSYTITADPLNPGATGQRYFFMNESGVIRTSLTAQATVTDPPIQ